MTLNEEVRVRLVKARVGVVHREEERQPVTPREQLLVERQHRLVVGQLDRERVVGYAAHDLGELVTAGSASALRVYRGPGHAPSLQDSACRHGAQASLCAR
jgi:hypothetical protein